jgi:hypothetical protein
MTDGKEEIHRRELVIRIPFETYQNPEERPAHRERECAAMDGLELCENLFWTVQQLGHFGQARPIAFSVDDLYEALEGIGRIGRAIAVSTGEQVNYLGNIAVKQAGAGDDRPA